MITPGFLFAVNNTIYFKEYFNLKKCQRACLDFSGSPSKADAVIGYYQLLQDFDGLSPAVRY